MGKWNVTLFLNNGKELEGIHEGLEPNDVEVTNTLLSRSECAKTFRSLKGKDGKSAIIFCVEDVSAMILSLA